MRGAVRAAERTASRRRDPSPARDMARRVRRRLKRERKTSGDGMRCMAAIADEIAAHPKLDDLHGNTRPGLARAVRREFAAAAGAVYAHQAAGEITARRIEGAPQLPRHRPQRPRPGPSRARPGARRRGGA